MTPRIASLGHVGIFVDDVDRSLRFYRDLLGLTLTDADEHNGMYFLSSRPDEEHHEFLVCRGRTAARDARLIQQVSFRCPSLQDVVLYWERLKAAGVEFDRIVSHGNAVGVYFFDPDHNRCEVYWPTGLKARQTFLAQIDLSRPVDELMTEIKSYVERYGETGYVDPELLRNSTNAYDVIVIGAGPTGLAAGLFLHAHGMRVALLEREAATVVEPRAVTLDDESMRAMATLGLIAQLQPLILPGYGTRWYTGTGRELARVSANATRYGYGCRNGFAQPDLVNLLARTLAERADVRFETTVTSVEQDANGVTVKARGKDGWPETYRARFAIACDGAASPIREALGIQLEGDTHAQPWLIVDTINSTETDRYSKFYCGNPRPYVAVPGRDGRLRYEFMYMPGEDPEQMRSADDVRRWLQGRRDLRDEDIIRIAPYRFHSRVSPRWRSGRLFFAGDAAHLMPPFAGQGMNAGIRDAFNLSWKLAQVMRGHAGDALLDTYERERKPHVRAMLKLSEIIGTVVMSRDSTAAKARDVFLGTARHVPGLREYIAEMRFKPKASYRDGFVYNKGPLAHLTGRLAPNPMVVDEHNLPRRLDDVLGDGFALISISASGNPVMPQNTSPMLTALNARLVRLCSGEFIALAQPGCVTVADTHAAFARELGLGRDASVLVRPDRVIAAATTPTTFAAAERYFTRTYSD